MEQKENETAFPMSINMSERAQGGEEKNVEEGFVLFRGNDPED